MIGFKEDRMFGFLGDASPQPPYRLPAYGQYAGEGFYPIEFLPDNYRYYYPYVVSMAATLSGNSTQILTYRNVSDSDFIIIKSFSIAVISYDPASNTIRVLSHPSITVSMRVGTSREITSEPTAFDLLFPDRHFMPYYYDVPLFLSAGDALEVTLFNSSATSDTVTFAFSGIRAVK
jgi:hypothetical protein